MFIDPKIEEQANLPSVEGGRIPLNKPRWTTCPVPQEGLIDTHRLVPVRHLGDDRYACRHNCYGWDDVTLTERTADELDSFWITTKEELERLEQVADELVNKYLDAGPKSWEVMLTKEPWVMDMFKPYDHPENRAKYADRTNDKESTP